MSETDLIRKTAEELRVGDRVRFGMTGTVATVRAIAEREDGRLVVDFSRGVTTVMLPDVIVRVVPR